MRRAYRDGSLGAYYPAQPPQNNGVGLSVNGLGGDAEFNAGVRRLYGVLAVLGGALGVYHGYKRNQSVGWAVVWGLAGSAFPIVTLPLSMAQGFAERKKA